MMFLVMGGRLFEAIVAVAEGLEDVEDVLCDGGWVSVFFFLAERLLFRRREEPEPECSTVSSSTPMSSSSDFVSDGTVSGNNGDEDGTVTVDDVNTADARDDCD